MMSWYTSYNVLTKGLPDPLVYIIIYMLKRKYERLITYLKTYKRSTTEIKRILTKLLVINKLKVLKMLKLYNHYGKKLNGIINNRNVTLHNTIHFLCSTCFTNIRWLWFLLISLIPPITSPHCPHSVPKDP